MNSNKDEYISYQQLPSVMGINKGDIVLLSSDVTDLFIQCKKHGEKLDLNILLNKFQEAITKEGTLLIPTYNWGFCKGKAFDYNKTPSKTGIIGDIALKRKDFKRTKHPIYSFAVWGKDMDFLCSLENKESFGADSPFAYLEKVNAKNAFIGGASLRNCFTYVHYIEQKLGADYRFPKLFRSHYIDENNKDSIRDYSMYVRYLDKNIVYAPDPFVDELYANHIVTSGYTNGILYEVINFKDVTPFIEKDILYNRSKKICIFDGQ
jgi:aminoglycoside 3-N-acetyltransferase